MADEEAVDPAMRGELRSRGSDRQIATLAGEQEGVLTRVQLLALGLSSSAIDRRLAGGRLHPLHRGVYAVGDRCLPPLGRLMAAVLASGAAAVASHRSAAALHGIRAYDGWPEVTGLPGARPRPGIRLKHSQLLPDEITVVRGIPVTTVARMLVDLGAAIDGEGVAKTVRQAEFLGLFDLDEVARVLERYPRRRGTARLRKAIAAAVDSERRTRSDMEERFRALLVDGELPTPETNGTVELGELTIEADAVWRDPRLIIDLDGRQAHLTRHAFETDRERDRAAVLGGWTVIRVTWRQLSDQRQRLGRDIRRLLARTRS